MDSYHIAVMLREAVEGLGIQGDGVYVDVTFGGGGHSREILSHLNQRGVLLAIDQDPAAEQNMIKDPRFNLLSGNFRFIENLVKGEGYDQVHGVLADLGISSHQIDEASRGFAHRWDGPLDMRMNSKEGGSAADWINEATDREMFQVFRTYGEIERPGVLVRAILKERELAPILTTARLRSLAEPLAPRNKKSQFLSKIFQAIRIEVNGEMEALEELLNGGLRMLKPGGRFVVISYHSLEDRMVKRFFRSGRMDGVVQKDFYGKSLSPWKMITRKAIQPSPEEIEQNTRARSARLRIVEKLP